jgi:flagellar motor switch/type III secretory pathway protein FliN
MDKSHQVSLVVGPLQDSRARSDGWNMERTNTVITKKTAVPMIEANSPKNHPVPEQPIDRDPGEFLPWLPCTLALDLPVVKFTVGDLLSLHKGSIVETAYHQSSDLPLRVNGQLVGWTEFEVVGERLAVRLTDLS